MRKALSNKSGFGYVLACVVVLITVMVIVISLQYAAVYHVAMEQRSETQLKLDGYMTRYAVENFDALKQGAAWESYVDHSALMREVYTLLGFPTGTSVVTTADYFMSRPVITTLSGESMGVTVSYEIVIPFVAFGQKIADIIVPTVLISRYVKK